MLLVAVLFGHRHGPRRRRPAEAGASIWWSASAAVVFRLVGIVMRAAPVGAFGAMAFTVGNYGVGQPRTTSSALVATFYLTSLLFVLVVLGAVSRARCRLFHPAR